MKAFVVIPAPDVEDDAAIEQHVDQEFGTMRATEFHLIESKLKSTGAEYTTLQTFRFASES